ncbi:MAG: hypothetical protein JO021_08460, partial [Alphaproteobacteria bacterium]|nr:hypothetical protein [Alphaproteobacteria bacterium]
IAAYILACAVISLLSTALLKDYTNQDISREYDETRTPPATPRRSQLHRG